VGATLSFLTPFVTLSFLITTPDAWVSALGDAQHGFPYLSGGGRLVLKDVIMLAGGLLIMADSARALLKAHPFVKLQTMTASKNTTAAAEWAPPVAAGSLQRRKQSGIASANS
jgi:hypothetical protein